jgi:hypothetical protein
MSKLGFIFFSIMLLGLRAPAQVLVHQFFPIGVITDIFGDTLINKREILVKAGIRKINIRQSPPVVSSSIFSKTYLLDQNGNIESLQYCFYNPKSDSTYCYNNKFSYASNRQMYELKLYDAKETLYGQYTVEWLDNNSAKCTSTTIFNGASGDTLVDYKYYNEKGQLIKLTQLRKAQEPFHSLFYYNKDGLLESVSYPNSPFPTTKFSRKHKGKNELIEWEHPKGKFSLVYNSSGQCLRAQYESKNQAPILNQQPYLFGNPKPMPGPIMTTQFYYNPNGTLSKITEQQLEGKELTLIYSYE